MVIDIYEHSQDWATKVDWDCGEFLLVTDYDILDDVLVELCIVECHVESLLSEDVLAP